ncbi:MAG: class I SAM-dependent methyltransferase [Phycisphaeraceae bacterium]|nr:class I SAM-dependent methyltransferase [Phycisphaeraceae bacterium]
MTPDGSTQNAANGATTRALAPSRFSDATWQGRVLRRYYFGKPGWQDGTTLFHQYILTHAKFRGAVLELGPGPSNRTTKILSEHFERVDGLDVDPECRQNEFLDEAYVYDGGAWPTPSDTYDAIVADFVFEHVADPKGTLTEARRCLRPGGVLVLRTPNLWHYATLGSAITPHWFHTKFAGKLRRTTAEIHDPYPTHYRLNTAGAVRRKARAAGLEAVDVTRVEREPAYGMASRLLFYPFMCYERVVNATGLLSFARSVIFAVLRKPDSGT